MFVSSSNLGAETVEHEVWEEDEEALGPGVGPGAGWAEHQPARVHRGRGCGDLAQVSVDTATSTGGLCCTVVTVASRRLLNIPACYLQPVCTA